MKRFLAEDFLLSNTTAVKLYAYARTLPIFDYHCHISPAEIALNRKFRSITELWLGRDHYKWRAMRSNGVEERYITGDADDKEKFLKWAETIPECIGNPLYHWTHLELKRYFGIEKQLSPDTAEEIWEECNNLLKRDEFSVRELIRRSNVKVICTTDDPLDSLEYHKIIAEDKDFGVKVYPSFRPDRFLNIDKEGFIGSIEGLGAVTGCRIESFEDMKQALAMRMDFFGGCGCRSADHALDPIAFREGTDEQASAIFLKAFTNKEALSEQEIQLYKTRLLLFLGREYSRRNWAMQLHLGTIRNTNRRMLKRLGPDTGFDAIGDYTFSEALCSFMNSLDETDELPRTILFCLNPRDNELIGSVAGCFQGSITPGKIQFGSSWWFNNHKDGTIRHMTTLANLGLLGRFIGMLTDSRCFLSYTRHEYFRRLLCSLLGEWAENGEIPYDLELLANMVRNICYYNAERYFGATILQVG
jgi:glucuronate isomerase